MISKPKTKTIEVVVVHGMGRQKPGETLLEWSEALLARIDWFAKASIEGVSEADAPVDQVLSELITAAPAAPPRPAERLPGAAEADDDQTEPSAVEFGSVALTGDGVEVPATVRYRDADGTIQQLAIRFTEACWSESFQALSKPQFFQWGLLFVLHTAAKLYEYSRILMIASSKSWRWLWWLPAAIGITISWLVISIATVLVMVLLALLGPLLLIPFTKKLLEPVVDVLVDFVGDVPAWSRHPVRAAAMRTVVEKTIVAARKRAGKNPVVVIAHSEGAAITVDLLFGADGIAEKTKVTTLVTVGAAVTLIGRPGWSNRQLTPRELELRGQVVALNPVRRWAALDEKVRPRWINFWAVWDVVPAGPISTGRQARRDRWSENYSVGEGPITSAALGPEEHQVHNTASLISDHPTYSSNVVQVLDPLARSLMGLDDEKATVVNSQLVKRNRVHVTAVRALGLNRVLIGLFVVLSLTIGAVGVSFEKAFPGAAGFFRWLGPLGLDIELGKGGFFDWLFSLSFLPLAIVTGALAALLLWVNSFIWNIIEHDLATTRFNADPGVGARRVYLGFRILLAVIVVFVAFGVGRPLLREPGEWVTQLLVAAVTITFVVLLPRLGRAPRVVRANVTPEATLR